MAEKETNKMTEQKKKSCKVEKCKGAYRAKGYCTRHYRKWRQGEFGKGRYKGCGEEGCRKPMVRHGKCADHYKAWCEARKSTAAQAPVAPAVAPESLSK